MVSNPVLPGFNADPSILRVGEDFFIATSTFEWFPGVSIYHSRDLSHWRLRSHALTRASQLELRGVQGSGGVWAPSLRYRGEDRLYYLAWTNVRNSYSMAFDLKNYLVTAPSMDGPWSEPIYLNASGFDPCIFFDDDGGAWLLNLEWEFRKGYEHPGWIVLQEYSIPERRLVGPIRHASLVDTGRGEWYVAHLGARPVMPEIRCVLGRETSLRKAFWTDDGWLRLEGGRLPLLEVPSPSGLQDSPAPGVSSPGVSSPGVSSPGFDPTASRREDFDGPSLPADFYSQRSAPDPAWLDLEARPGWLRLRGRESLRSLHEQSLVARRVQHFSFRVETSMSFRPEVYQAMAGLILMIGTENWYYLRKYWSESLGGPALGIMTCLNGADDELLERRVSLGSAPDGGGASPLFLAAEASGGRELAFSWSPDGRSWARMGPALDFTLLSDECSRREAFSGTFCGLCAQDLSGRGAAADFDYFDYEAR